MKITLLAFDYDIEKSLRQRSLQERGAVQKFIDSEVIRRMDPYTPFRDGDLKSAPIKQTSIGSGLIVQQTPYARRWYNNWAKFNGAPTRGNKWFEKMKVSHKESILRGAAAICGGRAK
ncbi:minor capsid protein [uncultured Anaerococcus sp.]|uniref:minor capsid protein n=1 Tax=uncultured Anaerococcus sp. TaxID=293428 RepID=UPI00260D2D69|nr:minor capsid protein [uncultured Anaerococcus sp.]